MGRLTAFAIDNARLTILLLAFIVITGITSFLNFPSQEDPEITIRTAAVTTRMPGLSPERIENLITKPLERSLKQIPEVKEIRSTSTTGQSVINVELDDQYFELDPIWQDLRNKMNDIKRELPSDAQGPYVNDDFGRTASATVAIVGDHFTMADMRVIAEDLQDEYSALDAVSRVDILGLQEERVWLEMDPVRLSHYKISPSQITQALSKQNIILPGGDIDADGVTITIEPSGNFESIDDIKLLTIATSDTEFVYLQDLVNIRRGYIEPLHQPAFYNNREAVVLSVAMVANANIFEFDGAVQQLTTKMQQQVPLGIELSFATYQPVMVQKAIDGATSNLYQTIGIVLAVVMIFLGLRTGLIVGSLVPLAILLSLLAMGALNIPLQRMSIAAIIISLGLLVDNGIVIAEDIKRRLGLGESRRDAAISASQSLGVPLLTSSLTTILAFMPLMLAEDVMGEYLRSLSQVIITTLLSSWFLAIFAIPCLCYWFLPEQDATAQQEDTQAEHGFVTGYRKLVETVLRFRLSFIGLMVGILVVALYGFKFIDQQLMAGSDRNQFLIYINLPAGSTTNETLSVTRRLATWLDNDTENPEVSSNMAYIASGGPRFFLALEPVDPDPSKAFLVVNIEEGQPVGPVVERTNRYIKQQLPEADGTAKKMWLSTTEKGLVEYRIKGDNIGVLSQLGGQIESGFRAIDGSQSIKNDWETPTIKVRVEIDQARARRAGVTSEEIARALNAYYKGVKVSDYREGDQSIPILLRGDQQRNDLDRLRTLELYSISQSTPVPLIQVADFVGEVQPSRIKHLNQKRTMVISGKHESLSAKELHAKMQSTLDSLNLPAGYEIELAGEIKGSDEANSALFAYMPHCLALIVVLLVWQFNSFRRPAIIMLTIPLVLIGASAGLLASGTVFDFNGMLGVFSLAGIIINNGIVLIDRIELGYGQGEQGFDAIINACAERLRPILITTLTTILGLIPLAVFGGELWRSLGVVMISGLAVGSILTLAFVPALYAVMFRVKAVKAEA